MKENFYFEIVRQMHDKFGFTEETDKFDQEKFDKLMDLRVMMMQEELNELKEALENRDKVEVVDALADLAVFLFGTVDMIMPGEEFFSVYMEVMNANLAKERGVKPGRPNPLGLPDLIKPEGWQSPQIAKYCQQVDDRLAG